MTVSISPWSRQKCIVKSVAFWTYYVARGRGLFQGIFLAMLPGFQTAGFRASALCASDVHVCSDKWTLNREAPAQGSLYCNW
jgi:hypothetical protein